MVIGAVVLFSALLSVLMTATFMGKGAAPVPGGDIIVHLKLDSGVGEQGREPTLTDPFPFARPTVRQIVDTLDAAALDDHVRAVIVELESGGIDLAHIQEMRMAVKRFRLTGKPAYIYSSSYGEVGQGLGGYYLASAFNEVWMQPVGMLSIAGIGLEVPYIKKLMDEYGVKAEFFHLEEYKNAMESFTASEMSKPSRDMMLTLVEGMAGQMLPEIAADRSMKPEQLKIYIDSGLLTGQEAFDLKLVDRLDYIDALTARTQTALGGDPDMDKPPLVEFADYAAAKTPVRHGPDVALVYITGMIASGGSREGMADADRIADAIMQAADDDDFKAVVIRIDSPGGSPTASETIRHAIVKAKEQGKKVIVSMGPVAASGGYWVAVNADRIFALPSTLTGSIGVVMGKFQISGLWDKLNVNWESVKWGKHAGLWSINEGFSESEQKRILIVLNDIYTAFMNRVIEGRGMPPEKVRDVAKGRAWTGEQAYKLGLVDELGGLDAALNYVARDVGAKDRTALRVTVLPHAQGTVEQLIEMFGGQVSMPEPLKDISILNNKIQVINKGPVVYDPLLDLAR